MFRKNKISPNSRFTKTSPVIKSSLSQSALVSQTRQIFFFKPCFLIYFVQVKIQAGGVKKLRAKTKLRQDENQHRGAIVLDGNVMQGRKTKSAMSLTAVAVEKKKPAEKRMLALIDENSR